ncbi:MAG: hypothetical protein JNK45_24635 [Myxococcales bacterium]|nr:hypothetical protein [Myxococcales bacterium]
MARLTKMLFVACVLATGCDLAGETMGPRGGTVVSEDGRFSLEIAPGALDHDVEVTIATVACGAMDQTALGSCYEVGPRGTAFLFPARVTFELDADGVAGVTVDHLALSGRREHGWDLLADRAVDLEDGTVSASALYLSSFALVSVEDAHHGAATREPAGE